MNFIVQWCVFEQTHPELSFFISWLSFVLMTASIITLFAWIQRDLSPIWCFSFMMLMGPSAVIVGAVRTWSWDKKVDYCLERGVDLEQIQSDHYTSIVRRHIEEQRLQKERREELRKRIRENNSKL